MTTIGPAERFFLVSLCVLSSRPVQAAPNDFEIQSAKNTLSFVEGQQFPKGAIISIPEGASITIIDRTGPIVRSRRCVGKYDGPIDWCTKAMMGGGAKAVPGATRGIVK